MDLKATEIFIPGCGVLDYASSVDARGSFIKPFSTAQMNALGIEFTVAETFISLSKPGVVRGMHLQGPPLAQKKLVACLEGRVLDVLVDLRIGSPAYGKVFSIELDSRQPCILFVAPGVAHGFCTFGESALMSYWVDRPYSSQHDLGVRWDSLGFRWPVASPVLSPRDAALPPLKEFSSPFPYKSELFFGGKKAG